MLGRCETGSDLPPAALHFCVEAVVVAGGGGCLEGLAGRDAAFLGEAWGAPYSRAAGATVALVATLPLASPPVATHLSQQHRSETNIHSLQVTSVGKLVRC